MHKVINILPKNVFGKIAAGEVVENPAAVVKECVENSLDAGATRIEVAIKNGGLTEIVIGDNGTGVAATETEKVFAPHATSKIRTEHDLDKIQTLGFRGEAMNSIASVSQVIMTTRTAEENTATTIELEGGEVTAKKATASNTGTTIRIRNLFFNTPARKKFLSSPRAEQNNVTTTINRLILGNPGKSWRYSTDDDCIYDYHPSGDAPLLGAIGLVYGRAVIRELLQTDAKTPGMHLHGFISNPAFTKKNRTYQTVMINGRCVEGGIVAEAANEAFSAYQDRGAFPFFVLNLVLDETRVDVNIHPRKAQVKFDDEDAVFAFVRDAITNRIDRHMYEKTKRFAEAIVNEESGKYPQKGPETAKGLFADTSQIPNIKQAIQTIKYFAKPTTDQDAVFSAPNIMNIFDELDKVQPTEGNDQPITNPAIRGPVSVNAALNQTKLDLECGFKSLGSLFATYLLFEDGESFYILDQHAAAERHLFDQMKADIDNKMVVTQEMLEPIMLYLNPAEMNMAAKLEEAFEKIGISMRPFGNNCVRIERVPVILANNNAATVVIKNVLAELGKRDITKISDLIGETILLKCCHAAVRGGTVLSNEQITAFLDGFKGGFAPTCPHGRPVVVTFNKNQIDKMFSRR